MASASEMTRFICLFHSADRARSVVSSLQQAGIAQSAITSIAPEDLSGNSSGQGMLSDIGVPARDLEHLQEGLRHGGVIVSLEAPEQQSDTIEKIFHRYSADKVDETETNSDSAVATGTAEDFAVPAVAYAAPADAANETVIPVAEESLVVGKREVDRGGVRVFRRTVNEAVQQDVNLHQERVALEYREVNRPATEADLRAGSQSIELVETEEVPVVQKVSRVVEEIRVGKVASDRTEVINDTVRHTEVDVEPVETFDTRVGSTDR